MNAQRIAFLFTLAIVAATYLPQLGAPFELQDDHRIVAPLITPHPAGVAGAIRMWASTVRGDVDEVGRFRPVSQIFDVIGPLAFGPHPLLWHCISVVLALLVAALLFLAALRLWHSPVAAAVFALITLLAPDPGPTAAWYRLGPKESWDMLFLSLALLVIVSTAGRITRGNEVFLFVLVVLTALSKESFLLLVPALYGMRVWLEMRAVGISTWAAIRKLRFAGVAYALLFLAGIAAIAYVVRSAGAHSYGGRSLAASPIGTMHVLLRDLIRTPSLSAWFVPALLGAFVAWRRRIEKPVHAAHLVAAVVFCAWIVPQFALHGTRGGFWDHYWLPCIVAFAAINAAGMAILAREPRPLVRRLALLVASIWMINAIRVDISSVVNFKTKARVQQEAVRIAAAHVTPQSILLIVANAAVESERAPGFVDFLTVDGGRFRRALLADSRCATPPCRLLDLRSGAMVDAVAADDVSVVAYLDPNPATATRPGFVRKNAEGFFRFLSLRHLGWTAIPFTIPIDVRNGT
jgi:hypothetical protein